jgi:multiple sugar transport system substrate-binding protein
MSSQKISRREFLKSSFVFGTAASFGSLLAGCGTQEAPAETEVPGTVTGAPTVVSREMTLQFPSWQQDEPGSSDWWKARIADFEQTHPGVNIEFTKIGVSDIAPTLLTQFSAGSPPQIIHLPFLNMFQFADQGFLEPLDNWLETTDVPEIWTPLQQGTQWEGSTYAILLLAYGYAMIYNEMMFEEAGQAIPTTSQEFVNSVKAITKPPDIFGYGTTTQPGFNMLIHMETFMIGNGGHLMTDGVPSVITPEAIEGVSQWVDIVKSGASPTGLGTGELRQLLTQGKSASYFDGPWGQGFIRDADPEVKPHLKVTRLPFEKVFGGSSNIVAMPATLPQEQKEVVWEFIQSLTTPEAQKDYVLKYCVAPSRQDLDIPSDELHESCPLIDPWLEASNSPDLVDYFPYGLETKAIELSNLVSESGQVLITTDTPVEEEMERLQQRMEDLQQG